MTDITGTANIIERLCPECQGHLQWRCPACKIAQTKASADTATPAAEIASLRANITTMEAAARAAIEIVRACRVAAEVLADEELNLLEFKALKAGLAKAGMERLYEHIMGDKLSHPEPRRAGTMAPAALVAEVHMSRYTLEWLDGPLPEGTVLHKALPCDAFRASQCRAYTNQVGVSHDRPTE